MAILRHAPLSRRSFVLGGSATAAVGAAGATGYLVGYRSSRECEVCTPDERAWRQLAQRLEGNVLRPGDAGYRQAARPNNLRYDCVMPQGIARCRLAEDVAAAIQWCRDHDMPLALRSGGHSYAGYSTTYGLMLDLTLMNAVTFDRDTGLVTVAGGAVNSVLYAALAANNATITHGRCPTVGAAAFLLGGGIGFNMRRNGLACDQMVRTELVTADGTRRAVNATDDPALFWALRGGGGGNFGVSTSFTLQTFPANPVTVFSLQWIMKPEAVTDALMPALQAAPNTLGSRLSLGAVTPDQRRRGMDVTVNLLGQLVGSRRDLLEILAPATSVAEPAKVDIRETSYWDGQKFLSEPGDATYFQERSAFVDRPFGNDALAEGFRWLRDWPGTHEYCDLRFFQTGDAMNAIAPTATAFVHRNSHWLMVVGLYWNEMDNTSPDVMRPAHDWQDGFYRAMLPFAGGGAYQNFPDPSLADWRQSYYGVNLDHLTRIKAAIDPTNVFQFPQAL